MENDNYLLVSLDDEKSKSIAEVLSSKTSKKIIEYLSNNKEASQKDLSDELKIPLNTIGNNIKKLLAAGFIKKRKNFFWSKKGKKIIMYELSKKSIIISPKKSNLKKIKSILPAFILTLAGTFAIGVFQKIRNSSSKIPESQIMYSMGDSAIKTGSIMPEATQTIASSTGNPLWPWFLLGSLMAIAIISIVNWRKL